MRSRNDAGEETANGREGDGAATFLSPTHERAERLSSFSGIGKGLPSPEKMALLRSGTSAGDRNVAAPSRRVHSRFNS
jgi:hypothetical protein